MSQTKRFLRFFNFPIARAHVIGAFFVLLCLTTCDKAFGDLVVTQRESFGQVGVFAGSGGAVDSSESQDSMATLSGSFDFNDSLMASVTESQPFSNGAAEANSFVNLHDDVSQVSDSLLILSASRSSTGMARHISGTGNANSSQNQEFRVRFQVNDVPAQYTLSGLFNPGDLDAGAHSLRLHRPFTANELFFIDSPGPLNETGILQAGKTYELRLLMNDQFSANAGNPGPNFGSSSFNFRFTVSSVPEPSSGIVTLFAMTGIVLTRRRKC